MMSSRGYELRTVSAEGRVKIPATYLRELNINPLDIVEINCDNKGIHLKKFNQKNQCVITGKITSKGQMFGQAFISDEGLKIIKKSF